jgi:phytoene synthase
VSVSAREAYSRCEAITRAQAANFYYGIRLLPHDQRRAMCAAYAFARRVDDIGDGELKKDAKLRRLDEAAADLAELERPGSSAAASDDPVIVALADAHGRFSLPPGALGELIEGVRMDVNGVTYERFEDLVLYCRRVAGAIGRVCLAIFGRIEAPAASRADADALADDLGVALQLTNILRDIREDAENGRVYLPAEDLRRFGVITERDERASPEVLATLAYVPSRSAGPAVSAGAGGFPGNDPAADAERSAALQALVRFEAERAQTWFDRGMELTPLLDRRSAACVSAMVGIYHRLLERIEADPERALRERASVPTREKVWVAIRSMLVGHRGIGGSA